VGRVARETTRARRSRWSVLTARAGWRTWSLGTVGWLPRLVKALLRRPDAAFSPFSMSTAAYIYPILLPIFPTYLPCFTLSAVRISPSPHRHVDAALMLRLVGAYALAATRTVGAPASCALYILARLRMKGVQRRRGFVGLLCCSGAPCAGAALAYLGRLSSSILWAPALYGAATALLVSPSIAHCGQRRTRAGTAPAP